jgi:hypothetical protein
MNQSVIFTDLVDVTDVGVSFYAQQQGQNITCRISFSQLGLLAQEANCDVVNAKTLFEEYRFDMEDWAESLIAEEAFNDQGEIILTNQNKLSTAG